MKRIAFVLHGPANPNTRGQMAVFLTRTFGLRICGPAPDPRARAFARP